MRTPDRDPNLRLTRRRFVQGIAAVSLAAMVEGKSSLACSEMISNSPAVLAGNHFDLTIKPHQVNFTGKEVKAMYSSSRWVTLFIPFVGIGSVVGIGAGLGSRGPDADGRCCRFVPTAAVGN